MSGPGRRLGALVAGLALALAVPFVGPVGPAAAAACSGTSGVTVVVDSSVGCAAGDPSSALAALHAAGHSTVMVQRFPAALCRIDGAPASDACVVMPPASAYWSLWTARRGGSWSFASSSITGVNPAPGTVVGLAFGAGNPPGIAPPAAAAPPKRTTPPAATSSPTTGHHAGSSATTSSTASTPHPASTAAHHSATVSATAAPSSTAASPSPTTLGPVAAASRTTSVSGGGALPLALGGALVLALGGATAYVVARRRRG